jgi:hypothetical protein
MYTVAFGRLIEGNKAIMYTVVLGRQFVAHQFRRRVWQADRRQSV